MGCAICKKKVQPQPPAAQQAPLAAGALGVVGTRDPTVSASASGTLEQGRHAAGTAIITTGCEPASVTGSHGLELWQIARFLFSVFGVTLRCPRGSRGGTASGKWPQ
jgi:hypothetical protein